MQKKHRRLGGLFVLLVFVSAFLAVSASATNSNQISWTGQGSDSVKVCSTGQTPYLHWIFTTGGNSSVTAATLTVTGAASGGGAMSQHGGSWTLDTPYTGTGQPSTSTLSAHVTYTGALGNGNANLVISDGCYVSPPPPTYTITVNKVVATANDTGKFNLLVDSTVVAPNVGNGGTGTKTGLVAGTYTVTETAGTGTSLGDYTSSYSCSNGLSGSGTSVQVNIMHSNVSCTFTNTRKTVVPPTGTLKLCKVLVDPTNSGDKFNLNSDGNPVTTNAVNGSCSTATVDVGNHTVSEAAVSPASLDNYTATVSCDHGTANVAVVVAGQTTTCTFTNTRKTVVTPPGTRNIYVNKACKDVPGAYGPCPSGLFPFTVTCTGQAAQPTVLWNNNPQRVGTCATNLGGQVCEPAQTGNWKNDGALCVQFGPSTTDQTFSFVNQEVGSSTPGTPGPPGPQGPAGPSGPQGPTGPAGPAGGAGPQGATGPAGPQGSTGAQGPAGSTGANGQNGAPGANGQNGAPGANGSNGQNGASGARGAPGAKGKPGATPKLTTSKLPKGSKLCRNGGLLFKANGKPIGHICTPKPVVIVKHHTTVIHKTKVVPAVPVHNLPHTK